MGLVTCVYCTLTVTDVTIMSTLLIQWKFQHLFVLFIYWQSHNIEASFEIREHGHKCR